MNIFFKKLPIILSLFFIFFLFFLYSPNKNTSLAYTCGTDKNCSSQYKYCRIAPWTSIYADCTDTWNANYTVDCTCTTGTKDCALATNGKDTSACSSVNYGYNCVSNTCVKATGPDFGEYHLRSDCVEDGCESVIEDPEDPEDPETPVNTCTPAGGTCRTSCLSNETVVSGKTCTNTTQKCCTVNSTSTKQCGWSYYNESNCQNACFTQSWNGSTVLVGSSCEKVANSTQYHCCNLYFGSPLNCTRCSDDYLYCQADFTNSTQGCTDTWNAKYKLNCACDGTQGPSKYATLNCLEKGIDTSSCTKKPECNEFDENDKNVECDPKCRTEIHTGNEIECGKGVHTCDWTIYVDPNTKKETKDCTIVKWNDTDNNTVHFCTKECTVGKCELFSGKTYGECVTTPTPTPKPSTPSTTTLTFDLGLDGIGVAGDEPNPEDANCTPQQISQGCGSNQNPIRTNRILNVDIFDSGGNSVGQKSGTIDFNSTSGTFKGTIDLGSSFITGTYTVKVKSPGYLRRLVNSSQTITSGQTNDTSFKRVVTGNVNEDNFLNIEDYNLLLSCSEFSTDNKAACNTQSSYKTLADLDDNGTINRYDYNLFMRDLIVGQED